MGCRYCMLACPFQGPTYEWSSRLPKLEKCDLCYDRHAAGQAAACSEDCPTGAASSGHGDELIAATQRRVTENPGQCYPKIRGLQVVSAQGQGAEFTVLLPLDSAGLACAAAGVSGAARGV